MSGYDNHLVIKSLGVSGGDVNCIPNNEERYITFTKEVIIVSYFDKNGEEKDAKHQLRFTDSFKVKISWEPKGGSI